VARHLRCNRAVVVPPGAGPIRGARSASRPPTVLTRQSGVDHGAAPRAWAGERGHRRRPAATMQAVCQGQR